MKINDKFENLPGIYIIKNLVNGKVYIGESLNVKTRMRKHKTVSLQVIHNAFKKHGMMNFEIYVEYFPNFTKKDLVDLERELIIKFNCQSPNGYNILNEGSNWIGKKHSEETKKKMSEDRSGTKHTLYGTKWSDSHLQKKTSINIEELDNIIDLYFNQMKSTPEIGKIYNVSHSSVYRFLKRNGQQPRKVNSHL
jgi:group I intron endonuclease